MSTIRSDMAIFYEYHFVNNLVEGDPDFAKLDGNDSLVIYAASEEKARRIFKNWFKKDAGKLIERKPW